MNTGDETIAGTKTFSSAIASTVTTGTAPFTVASTTMVANLNADQLDGQEGSYYTDFSNQVVDASEVTDTMVADDLTISGGTVNSTPIGATTAAAADVTTLTVENSATLNEDRDSGIVLEVLDDNLGTALTVNATTGVFIDDLTLNDSFSLTGAMSATTYTTTAGDPTNDNHLARKAYVDAQIAANVSAFEVFDYAATASTINNTGGGNLTYYLNGANLFYQDNTAGDSNNASNGYTFTVYGSGMDQIAAAELYLRGTSVDLVNNNNWASSGSAAATFTLTYQNLLDLSGGSQTDGVMRCHLVLDGKNSGLTFKFHLDSTSSAALPGSFNASAN